MSKATRALNMICVRLNRAEMNLRNCKGSERDRQRIARRAEALQYTKKAIMEKMERERGKEDAGEF